MTRAARLPIATMLLLMMGGAVGTAPSPIRSMPGAVTSDESAIRFAALDIHIDPKGNPLAAFQFELKALGGGRVVLVGIEGGEHPAFIQPPFYDPAANLQNRIVVAAFNVGDDLPRTRTRVARIMVEVHGHAVPQYVATLDVAASIDARPIQAEISVSEAQGAAR